MWKLEEREDGLYLSIFLGKNESALSFANSIWEELGENATSFGWMTKGDAYEMANRINPDKFPLDKDQPYGNQPIAQRVRLAIRNGWIEANGPLIKRYDFIQWMHEARSPRGTSENE